jgi:hypothetical protein
MLTAHYTAGFRAPAAEADLVVSDLAGLPAELFRIASLRAGR